VWRRRRPNLGYSGCRDRKKDVDHFVVVPHTLPMLSVRWFVVGCANGEANGWPVKACETIPSVNVALGTALVMSNTGSDVPSTTTSCEVVRQHRNSRPYAIRSCRVTATLHAWTDQINGGAIPLSVVTADLADAFDDEPFVILRRMLEPRSAARFPIFVTHLICHVTAHEALWMVQAPVSLRSRRIPIPAALRSSGQLNIHFIVPVSALCVSALGQNELTDTLESKPISTSAS